MKFSDRVGQVWSEHEKDIQKAKENLLSLVDSCENEMDAKSIVPLASHILGNHLALWSEGLAFVQKIRQKLPHEGEAATPLLRMEKSFQLAQGHQELATSNVPDKIAVLTSAAGLLLSQNFSRASTYYQEALELAEKSSLAKEDPANRTLAVSGNNIACELEERPTLNANEKNLLLVCARAARKYWEIAGGPLQVERAEYRLAMSHRKIGLLDQAHLHANQCLNLCKDHKMAPLEFFFAYEALALSAANKESFNKYLSLAKDEFFKLEDADKKWCQASLTKLEHS